MDFAETASGTERPDVDDYLTSTSKPCGHRFSGDLPGFKGALPEQGML
jgi:hypothetical protein